MTIVTSPDFGGFRKFEPAAFDVAERAVRMNKDKEFSILVPYSHKVLGNVEVRVVRSGLKIKVYLIKDDEPFVFNLVEV